MSCSSPSPIVDLLMANLSRELLMAIEDALDVGARRAFPAAQGMHKGHLSAVLGHMRHFHMNETFAEALEVGGACPSQLRGNAVVVGQAGIIRIGRFNIAQGPWNNARRSLMRRVMSEANRAIEPLLQPDLFNPTEPITAATVFFVGVFSGSLRHSPDRPVSIEIAVPDSKMKSWLLRERISEFVSRYNATGVQEDLAVPVLKANVAQPKRDQGV